MSATAAFLFFACSVLAAVVAMVLWPLLRHSRDTEPSTVANESAQKASLQEALTAIDAEYARGELDAATADARRREVLLRARAEQPDDSATLGSAARARPVLAIVVTTCIAAVASVLYLWLGNPNAMNPAVATPAVTQAGQSGQVGPPQVAEMVKRLEAKLSAGPPKAEDVPGWKMLARSQMVMEQFGKAAASYRTALSLAPNDSELEVNLAEALLAQAEGKPSEEIEKLLAKAYASAPSNPKVLWLNAAVAQERGDKPKAVKYLKEARATLASDSDAIKQIDKFIADLSK